MNLFIFKKTYSVRPLGLVRLRSIKTEFVLRKYLEARETELVRLDDKIIHLIEKFKVPIKDIEINKNLFPYENQ